MKCVDVAYASVKFNLKGVRAEKKGRGETQASESETNTVKTSSHVITILTRNTKNLSPLLSIIDMFFFLTSPASPI